VSIFIVTYFYFLFRQTASLLLEETIDMSIEYRIFFFPFFKCPRVHPCECRCIHEDSFFFLSRLVDSTYFCGWNTWGCLTGFPRLKGRINLSLFFFFDYLVALIVNRFIVQSTFIPELGLLTVFSCGFLFIQSELFE
jgi:hypothetical protein